MLMRLEGTASTLMACVNFGRSGQVLYHPGQKHQDIARSEVKPGVMENHDAIAAELQNSSYQ